MFARRSGSGAAELERRNRARKVFRSPRNCHPERSEGPPGIYRSSLHLRGFARRWL